LCSPIDIHPCTLLVSAAIEHWSSGCHNNDGGGIEGDNVYIGSGEKVMLALLSDLYSKLDAISVGASRPSCSTLYCLLTIFNLRKEYTILV